ncbi:SGNH/GDSL hydrolase family protein [Microbacterium sp. zg.B96]|nr:SGNH/GDSL hydrolase family protein [Microbacterium sp. zg.B96]MCR2784967.1 SGNH/GDSL hydrolase family protein [Microbacterium sp. zg.B96]
MPLWGLVGVAALVIALGGWVAVNYQPPPSLATSAPRPYPTFDFGREADQLPAVAAIGDSFTGGSGMDSGEGARWPALLREEFTITTYHEGGTGYARTRETPDGSSNFTTRVDALPVDTRNLVFFGSVNDSGAGYLAVRAAARTAFQAAQDRAPGVRILVIGPASPAWPVTPDMYEARDGVRDAAVEMGLPFVDPIDSGWFSGHPEFIGEDGTHPNDLGHAFLSDRISAAFAEHFPHP